MTIFPLWKMYLLSMLCGLCSKFPDRSGKIKLESEN